MLKKMMRKLQDTLLTMSINGKLAVDELKNDESAMEVIQVVMLIAVGVLAIAAIWAGVNGLLEEWWNIIIGVRNPGGPNIPTP